MSQTSASLDHNVLNKSGNTLAHPMPTLDIWSANSSMSNTGSSPTFEIKHSHQVSFWWASEENKSVTIQLRFTNSDGATIKTEFVEANRESNQAWRLHTSQVPKFATGARIEITNARQWVGVSNMVEPIFSSAFELMSGKNVETFVPPDLVPRVPCANLPTSINGQFSLANYAAFEKINRLFPYGSATLTEIGTAGNGLPSLWLIEQQKPKKLIVKRVSSR